jgi:hypothetical protein
MPAMSLSLSAMGTALPTAAADAAAHASLWSQQLLTAHQIAQQPQAPAGAAGGAAAAPALRSRPRAEAAALASRARGAARASVESYCVRINSLVFAHTQLATLRAFVLGAWARLQIADETDARTGQRYAETLLRASDGTLRLAAREVCSHMGTRIAFLDARERLLEDMHAQPAGVRRGALRALLDDLLSPALETVLELVAEGPTRTAALLGVCCGAAYERVLLDGGETRSAAPRRRACARASRAGAACASVRISQLSPSPQHRAATLLHHARRRGARLLDGGRARAARGRGRSVRLLRRKRPGRRRAGARGRRAGQTLAS